MSMTDWHENSIFVPDRLRVASNSYIERNLDGLKAVMEKRFRRDACVFIGGSLARREPAIINKYPHHLVSDLDLVVVTDLDSGAWPAAQNLERSLANEFSELKVSVIVIPAGQAHRASSFFALDFRRALTTPLIRNGMTIGLPKHTIRRRNRLELIIHQVSSALLHHHGAPGGSDYYLMRASGSYHELKIMLECFRAVITKPDGEWATYRSVYELRHADVLRFIAHPRVIEQAIRDRELFADRPVDLAAAREIVVRSLAVVLGAAATAEAVARKLISVFSNASDILGAYQLTILIIFLAPSLSVAFFDERAGPALSQAWARVQDSNFSGGVAAATCLRGIPHRGMRGPFPDGAVIAALRKIRLDYYDRLGDHIFGMNPDSSYSELCE